MVVKQDRSEVNRDLWRKQRKSFIECNTEPDVDEDNTSARLDCQTSEIS
jgi:hypothetical protein